jgi:hypothetical protein
MSRSSSVPRKRLELLDTSVLLEILDVPYENDRSATIAEEFDAKVEAGVSLQIPMATVLETGAHIRRIKEGEARRTCARTFTRFLDKTLSGTEPWSFSPFSWDADVVRALLEGRGHDYDLERSIGDGVFEIGDLTIIEEWRLTSRNLSHKVYDVDVWTLDATLRGVVDGLRTR